jgi:hypothetical protein
MNTQGIAMLAWEEPYTLEDSHISWGIAINIWRYPETKGDSHANLEDNLMYLDITIYTLG